MSKILPGVAGVLLLLSGAAQAQQRTLSDAALEAVTAGGGSEEPSGAQVPPEGGVVVGDSSSATVRSDSRVEIFGSQPGDARVLNAVNAAASRAANGVNVVSFPSGPQAGPGASARIEQSNVVTQTHRPSAFLGVWSPGGPRVQETSHFSFSSQTTTARTASMTVIDRTFSSSTRMIESNLSVPGFNPFAATVPIGVIAPNPITIPSFGFNIDAIVAGTGFRVSGTVGPFTLSPPAVNFGNIDLTADNLTISGGSITLPALSGTVSGSGEICVAGECIGASGSDTFSLGAGALGTIPVPDIPLGPNPFKDTVIQAGGGIAGVGSGTLTAEAGSVGLDLTLSIQIPPIPGVTIDFPDLSLDLGPFGDIDIDGPTLSLAPITFPEVSRTVSLVDANFGGFSASFTDAAFCLDLTGSSTCPTTSAHFETQSTSEKSVSSSESFTISSHQDVEYSVSRQVLVPGVLFGAAGTYIALTDGTLAVEKSSSVQLAGAAQQGMTAMNIINVSGSMLATGLNVAGTSPAGPALAFSQMNSVTQVR
jgi:hypothetical protein